MTSIENIAPSRILSPSRPTPMFLVIIDISWNTNKRMLPIKMFIIFFLVFHKSTQGKTTTDQTSKISPTMDGNNIFTDALPTDVKISITNSAFLYLVLWQIARLKK